jgi:hypothetical protein
LRVTTRTFEIFALPAPTEVEARNGLDFARDGPDRLASNRSAQAHALAAPTIHLPKNIPNLCYKTRKTTAAAFAISRRESPLLHFQPAARSARRRAFLPFSLTVATGYPRRIREGVHTTIRRQATAAGHNCQLTVVIKISFIERLGSGL